MVSFAVQKFLNLIRFHFFSLFLSEFLKTVIKKMNECLWVRMSPLTTDLPKVHTKSLSKFLQIMDHVSNLHY